MKFAIIGASLLAVSSVALAAPRSVTLDIPGMTCPTCPITIKKALMKQPGVKSVVVHLERKQLDVAFDDAKTDSAAITKATASVGFSSQLVK